jgi:hypothetical protein
MGSQPDLLEELARVYARAAVDGFLAAAKHPLPGNEPVNEREVVHEVEGTHEAEASFDSAPASSGAVASSRSAPPSDPAGCKITGNPTCPPVGRKP